MNKHPNEITSLIPKRKSSSHKGTYGRVLIIAGSNKYAGAAQLVTEAALRSGAGMVFIAAIKQVAAVIRVRSPEAIIIECLEKDGRLDIDPSLSIIQNSIYTHKINAVCIGPGLGDLNNSSLFYGSIINILCERKIPCVFDADALPHAAKQCLLNDVHSNQFIFTPHPKELVRMLNILGITDDKKHEDLIKSVSQKIKQIIVYKTNQTIVCNKLEYWKAQPGSVALATAGTGDVLSGIIVGLLAQGLQPIEAAKLGVYLHGLAAKIGEEKVGIRSFLARDLCDTIPAGFQELLK